jgi:membrane-anchored mycosin MYCP
MEDVPGGERRTARGLGTRPAARTAATAAILATGIAGAAATWPASAQAATTASQTALCPQPVAESLSQIGLQPVPAAQQPWAQQRLDPSRVWPLTTGAGVTVAVIDSGVDAAYPALTGAVEQGADMVQQGQPANYDCVGHGTLVAGIIAARPQPGTGFIGIAPGTRILPVRQTESDQQEPNGADILAQAINYAVSRGAQVINISITTSGTNQALAEAVRHALDHDVVIVAAAGNDGASPYTAKQYPAGYPGVLAVGAVGQDGQPLSFSSPGALVVAPGTDIVGPDAAGTGLVAGEGTSFATAFVSGVAALVRSYLPGLTAAQVVDRIEATADHPAGKLPGALLGWGEVDPYAAVTAVLPGETPATPGPARLPLPPRSRPAPSQLPAELTAAVSLTVIAVVLAAAAVLPAARRRGWRPGTFGIPNGDLAFTRGQSDSDRRLNPPGAAPPAVQDSAPGRLPGGGDSAEQRPFVRAAGQHDPARP